MLDDRRCKVETAAELDDNIRDIFALDEAKRSDEISGTLYVDYSNESVREAKLVSALEDRGVSIVWRKKVP